MLVVFLLQSTTLLTPFKGLASFFKMLETNSGRRGSLKVSVLDSGASGLGSGPGWGQCIVFLGKTLYSHGVSLYPSV